jgi:hypothetical protein
LVFPLIGQCHYTDDYGEMRGGFRHTGVDIDAPKMTPIVAPFSGVIGFKRESFWIFGDNGWAMLGTHLNDDDPGTHDHGAGPDYMFAPNLVPGQHVEAGQFIGYVGMSGDATGPHLHFEVYVPGRGSTMSRIRDAYPSLCAAHVLSQPVIPAVWRREPPAVGFVRLQGCIRGVDRTAKTLNLILVTKQTSDGKVAFVSWVRYVKLRVSDETVDKLGGWSRLSGFPRHALVSMIVENTPQIDGSALEGIESWVIGNKKIERPLK